MPALSCCCGPRRRSVWTRPSRRRWRRGGGRWPATTRARSCWTWRSAWRVGGDCLADLAQLRAASGGVRPGRLGPDGVPADRHPGRRRAGRAGRDRRRARRGPGAGLGAGRRARARPRRGRGPAAGDRRGRDPGHRALGEGVTRRRRSSAGSASTRCGRSSTTVPRAPASRWRSCCAPATPARTPWPTTSRSSAPRWPSCPAGTTPARRCWSASTAPAARMSCSAWLTRRRLSYSVGFSLPGDLASIQQTLAAIPAAAWTAGLRRRRPAPSRRVGRRGHRPVRPLRLAARDAGDRAQGTPAPRRAAADHRRRRHADHRLRHQHQPRTAGRPGAAAPPPGPRRGPHPLREGHRADQPAAARLRPEPDLVRHRRARRATSPPGCRPSP